MNKPDLFKSNKLEWCDKARAAARKLLENTEYITIEQVTEVCPLPRYLSRNTIGGVFQHPDFQVVGYTLARRPSSNSRLIRKWALKHPPVPTKSFRGVEYDRGD